ncbi:MAG: hypothetical protein HC875_19305 [Anaerolineales bacterium]|nr:hypothetical protein [Anaerolineales bacterium]
MSNELEKQLHDRFTRGETLTEAEQMRLEEWYVAQDQAELSELNSATIGNSITILQTQVDSALTQLAVITKRIQEIAVENEALRQEVFDLQRQLAQQTSLRPV